MRETAPAPATLAERLRGQHASLRRVVAHCAPDALASATRLDAGWTARGHLAHLARYQEAFLERLRRMLAEDAPAFPRYRAEEDAEFPPFLALDTAALLARLDASRATLVAAVESLGPAELARTGSHPVLGTIPVALWLEFYLAHEGHHLYQILLRAQPPNAA
jgi:hypothetical protein